jgi:hypothetical protein
MPAIWDGDLDASLLAQPPSRGPAREAPASGPRQPSIANRLAARPAAAAPQPGISAQAGQDPPQPSWPLSPARSHPQQPASSPAADRRSASASPSGVVPAGLRVRPGIVTHDLDTSVQAAAGDPACWPVPDSHITGQNLRPEEQALPEPGTGHSSRGKQRQSGTAGAESVSGRGPQRSAAPDADWRDQILHQARQPGQPRPSWPHSPALRYTPELGGPAAGIELGQ